MDQNNEDPFPFYRYGPPGSAYFPPNYYRTPFRPPSSSGTVNFPIIAIAILGIIATALLLVCYYIFAVKFCLNWHRFGFLRRLSGRGSNRYRDPLIVFAATIHNSRGLDESVIRSIPIFQFKKGVEDGREKKGNECAVCLSEFQEDERLRLLPGCSHAFHIDCIDRWLQTNANCPLCRSSITSIGQFAGGGMVGNPVLPRPAGDHLVIEVSDGGNERSESSEDSSEMSSTQSSNSDQSPSPSKLEQSNPSKRQKRFHRRPSMGDECIDVRRNENRFGVQPLRRSFSVDSSSDRQLYLSVQETFQQNTQIQEVGSSSDTSSRSRRFFFPFGPGRGSRNAVLPIESEP